jgi:hypothetical protein
MNRKILLILFLSFTVFCGAQRIRFLGNISDTSSKGGLPNVLMMALKFSDSTLVSFSRTDKNGIFKPLVVPPDTYIVILSHPAFSDKTYLIVPSEKDTVFNLKNVVLPPKSVALKEVEIIAYREKSYYKGDTLVFTADSFKTKANATVEDLLKKLPGFRVDVNGKITVQGKQVDQVLVDGDEFFGTDPTVATRNLNATAIDNVQVYDKKNESTEEGKDETVKVINLKMKEDAKKGYFGKVSGASDGQRFYENELLANRFKGARKISLFGLVANTPKQAFNYGESDKYGLSNEQPWSYNEETNSWSSNRDERKGLPQTIKTGFYFNDKIGKKTKINSDYTFNQNRLYSGTETNTQFFLEDTSYSNARVNSNETFNQSHAFNLKFNPKLDSLTELTVFPKLRYSTSSNSSLQTDDFISQNGAGTRQTILSNDNKTENKDVNVMMKLSRNFMKKDRNISFVYQPVINQFHNNTQLNTKFRYFTNGLPDSAVTQKRTQDNEKLEHNASVVYVEPWTRKFKSEINYNFSYNHNTTNRQTYDLKQTGNDIFNPAYSNNFDNLRTISRGGLKLIYDVKKYRISAGTQVRNVIQRNLNLTNNQKLTLDITNILPNAAFVYRISQGSNFNINYNTNSQQPDLQQMQPVTDNSDPNRITLGNPDLKPTFSNNFNLNYYFYKGISDVNFYSGAGGGTTDNQISYSTYYDSLGRAVTQPVNIDGNYFGNVWMGGGFPVFKRFMKIYMNLNSSHSNNISLVNNVRTISKSTSIGPALTFEKDAKKYEVRIEGNYDYFVPKTSLNSLSQQPYYTYSIEGNIMIKLPYKFSVETDGKYMNNGNRTPGYNLNYFIWNAGINKTFFKSSALVVSLSGNDLLNQNISNERFINSNQIVDKKTQIIRRYFLLKVLYKFNSQKAKIDEDEDDD